MNRIFLLLIALLFLSPAFADSDTLVKKLNVGIKESPPFIIKGKNGYSGISIDMWRRISDRLNYQYEFKEYELDELITAVKNGKVDLSINPLSVTSERIREMDFSQPYFITNLSIAVQQQDDSYIWLFITKFFSWDFFKAVSLLFLVILAFGFFLWMIERKKNPQQFRSGIRGIWDGIWWSAVTMTTVGYGDKAPVSVAGRLIAIVWMFTSIIIISGFTASIASSLVVKNLGMTITDESDLRRVTTGTVTSSSSEEYLNKSGISPVTYATVEEGLNALKKGSIKAFVYDEPILRYLISQNVEIKKHVTVLSLKLSKDYYALSFPNNSPHVDKVNPALLELMENEAWKKILGYYEQEN